MFAINDGRSDKFLGILGFVQSLTTSPAKNACLLPMIKGMTYFGDSNFAHKKCMFAINGRRSDTFWGAWWICYGRYVLH